MRLTRRHFMVLTAGAAAGAAIPEAVAKWVGQSALADSATMYFLTDATRAATCAAACARIVPTGSEPATDPGATEAAAVVFIDRFLSAFELPSAVADGPPVWLSGPFSNRNPYPDNVNGQPSSHPETFPPDSFYSGGQLHSLPLTRIQKLVWYAQLYGTSSLPLGDKVMGKWAGQVADGTIPGVPSDGLRKIYQDGLDALDAWSRTVTGQHFAEATPQQQDLMLTAVGNAILGAVAPPITSNLPSTFPQVAPPAAAQALYPVLVTHTFQACYGLPEYRQLDANPLWELIGFDGDTQPLGNSVYGSALKGDNEGFGCYPTVDDVVYPITGGYREYRPVSFITGGDTSVLSATEAEQVVQFLKKARSR
ncbi:MAG TPA: gluconate 2-dehydrogenase subunit 3 family protein [Acidimicrobiales bacterium]|nr:gluconate 2-dehydrogenase subunit 3 family protein [Acidimicrobiales bacterium]